MRRSTPRRGPTCRATAWLAIGCLLGCEESGGGGAAACPAFEACGGDLEGSWELTAVCVDADLDRLSGIDEPACAGVVREVHAMPDATYTFNAGTAQASGSVVLEMALRVTDRCVQALAEDPSASAAGPFCAQLQQQYNSGASESIDHATCTAGSGACTCRVFSTPIDLSRSGPYHVEGTTLIDEAEATREPYCVDGDTLTVESVVMRGSAVTGRMVLRRL